MSEILETSGFGASEFENVWLFVHHHKTSTNAITRFFHYEAIMHYVNYTFVENIVCILSRGLLSRGLHSDMYHGIIDKVSKIQT